MSNKDIKMKFGTKAIHKGQKPEKLYGSVSLPIYQTSTFKQNKIAPGTKLKVVSPNFFKNDNISGIIVLAAGYTNEVCKIIKSYKLKTKIAKINNNNILLSN